MVTPFSYASLTKDSEFRSMLNKSYPAKNLTAILEPVVANVSFRLKALKIDSLVFSSAQTAARPDAPHCVKPVFAYSPCSKLIVLIG